MLMTPIYLTLDLRPWPTIAG